MKRKCKIFGIIFITLLLPFILNITNIIIIFLLKYRLGIINKSMPIILGGATLIVLFVLLGIIFSKVKAVYLADAYIAGICFIALWIGLAFFAFYIYANEYGLL